MKSKVIFFIFLFLSGSLFSQTSAQAEAAAREALLRLEAALGGNISTSTGVNNITPPVQIAQGGVQPAWVNDPYTIYDRDIFFAVVGSAADRNQAEAKALSALTAIFGQLIQSDFTVVTMYTEAVERGVVRVSEDTNIRDTITRAASIDNLIGAQIGYVWDSGRNVVFAVAYLDKKRTVSIYTDLVIINNSNISLLTNISNEEKNTFESIARYRLASQIAEVNTNYLIIISQAGGSTESINQNSADFYKIEADNIFRNITISVVVDNDRANRVQSAFARVLSSEGLRTRDNNPPYVLEVYIFSSEAFYPNSSYKWCSMEICANLIESSTGASLIPFNFSLREGHQTYANAETTAYMMAEREIAERFPALLREYLASVMPD